MHIVRVIMDFNAFMFVLVSLFYITTPAHKVVPTSEAITSPYSIDHPINFKTSYSFMLTTLELRGTFSIYFLFKTTHEDGLIMYASGSRTRDQQKSDDAFKGVNRSMTHKNYSDQSRSAFKTKRTIDFLALELVGGAIRYIYRVGGDTSHMVASTEGTLADNRWHSVGVLRPTLNQHILKVDDIAKFDNLDLQGRTTMNFDLSEEFYVGGIPREYFLELPGEILSDRGYQGCLASLDLDGGEANLLEVGKAIVYEEYKLQVAIGCKDSSLECTKESCFNGGTCVHGWDSYQCDCSLTTFVGARCQEDGLTYSFAGGYITLNLQPDHVIDFKQQPEERHKVTSEDKMAFGLMTSQKNGEIIRIVAIDDSHRFLSVSLNNGRVVMKHGVGDSKFEFRSPVQVDDVMYHVITFVRSNYYYNSTLKVDGVSAESQTYTAQDNFLPERGCKIKIGRGTRRKKIKMKNKQTKPGLTINGINILEIVAKGENGEVLLHGNISFELRPITRNVNRTKVQSERTHLTGDITNRYHHHHHQEIKSNKKEKIKKLKYKNRKKLNRLQGPRYSSTDDLIEAKPTRSACLTSDDLDCPEFKDTDDLLVPTTRTRSLTDEEMRHRMWSSSPKIKMKGPDIYESSGNFAPSEKRDEEEEEETTPCSSDDEDCLTFSGAEELFFPTSSNATVAVAVETTPTSMTSQTSHVDSALMTISYSHKFVESENPPGLSTSLDEKFWRSSPRMYNPSRLANTTYVHYRNPSDFNRLNFSQVNQQQHHNNPYNNDNNYYYTSNVGRSLEKLTINIGLILGIAFGIAVLLLVLAFALFKYRNQFGGGAVGEKLVDYQTSKCVPLVFEPCKVQSHSTGAHNLQPLKVDVSLNLNHQQQLHQHQQQQQGTPRKKDIKEWYV